MVLPATVTEHVYVACCVPHPELTIPVQPQGAGTLQTIVFVHQILRELPTGVQEMNTVIVPICHNDIAILVDLCAERIKRVLQFLSPGVDVKPITVIVHHDKLTFIVLPVV